LRLRQEPRASGARLIPREMIHVGANQRRLACRLSSRESGPWIDPPLGALVKIEENQVYS
jgi:hypothetical protein